MIPMIPVPNEARCQEASILSHKSYIACGGPAEAIIYSDRDSRGYYMCLACADHNIRNRRGKVVTAKTEFLYRELLASEDTQL